MLQSLASLREDIREQTNQELVRLAISIAGRIIHREVSIDPDALSGLVKAAYLKLQSRELNRVRMHPTLEVLVRKILEQSGSPKNLVLMPIRLWVRAKSSLKPPKACWTPPSTHSCARSSAASSIVWSGKWRLS